MLDINAHDDYLDSQQNAPSWFFFFIWLGWIIVTIAGYLAGQWLAENTATTLLSGTTTTHVLTIQGSAQEAGIEGYIAAFLGGILSGAALGATQGLLLLPFMKVAGTIEWVLATIIGRTTQWMVIYIVGTAMLNMTVDKSFLGTLAFFVMLLLTAVLSGAALGYAQSRVFRTRTRTPGWWVAANIIGSLGAALVVIMTLLITSENLTREYSVLLAAGLTALATASALMEVLHHPRGEAEWRETLTWERKERAY